MSKVIPRNVRQSDGPCTFSSASGIPSSAHTALMVDKLWVQVDESGGPRVKNRPGIGELVLLVYVSVSRTASQLVHILNSFGADLRPNGKQASI